LPDLRRSRPVYIGTNASTNTTKLGTIKLGTIGLGTIKLGTIGLGTIKLGAIGLGAIKLGAIKLAIKMGTNTVFLPANTDFPQTPI